MTRQTMGVEEELMLVDAATGRVRSVSGDALAVHRARVGESADEEDFGADGGLDQELFLQQLETATIPCQNSQALLADLVRCRTEAAASARAAGAALVAVGTPVLPVDEQQVTPKARYERIVEEFGEVGRQGFVCGMHVHVGVSDEVEGVRVIDGLRPWLPVLRAMSANSPFWQGRDTGYASWRSQVWSRFPSAGPTDPFGDPGGYHAVARALVDSGAALDAGMLYFDARLARHYPTVEVRVFDVMTDPGDTVLLAVLTRALVTTLAARRVRAGGRSQPWRTELLRAAHWRASRYGLSAELLDPRTGSRQPARLVVRTLLEYLEDTLRSSEEWDEVQARFAELMARGTGADLQRAVAERGGGVAAVADDLRDRFEASYADAAG